MESIFYAALALHIAGKPVNKENIYAVLSAARTPVNERTLDAMAAFVEALESAKREKEKPIDPRIIRFLTSELSQQKVQSKQLEALLEELTRSSRLARETGTSIAGSEVPGSPENIYGEEEVRPDAATSLEVRCEEVKAVTGMRGRYVYGIAAGATVERLGPIGIESSEVYTIPCGGLCAVVHDCSAEPYQSSNDGIVKDWVRTHQDVLDEVKKRFGTVIPVSFDTILHPLEAATSPEQVVKNWLKEDYDRLRAVMQEIEGKDEYAVQVSYEPDVIGRQIGEHSDDIKRIEEEMATKPPGTAYMYKQRLEKAVKTKMEGLADEWFRDFYSRIRKHSDDVAVEKTRTADKGKVMLLNVSCLVAKEKVRGLGEELEKINKMKGFSIHFSGPWPPYSFVDKSAVPGRKGE